MSHSPSLSLGSLDDDGWDLISERTNPEHTASTPFSYATSDEEAHTNEELNTDLASDFSEAEGSDPDVTILRPSYSVETTQPGDNDDLDGRVNEALANSLASTLDPFIPRQSTISSRSGFASLHASSGANSALALSFPDPLTPSGELPLRLSNHLQERLPLASIYTSTPELLDGDAEHVHSPLSSFSAVSMASAEEREPETGEIDRAGLRPVDDLLSADVKSAAPLNTIISDEGGLSADDEETFEDAVSLRSMGSSTLHSRLGTASEAFLQGIQGQIISHPWTSSIIVSILAIVLGGTVFNTHSFFTSSHATPSTTVCTSSVSAPPVVSAYWHPPATQHSFTAAGSSTTARLAFQTPGAGPSNSVGFTRSVGVSEYRAPASTKNVKAESEVTTGHTRSGCSTPIPRKEGCQGYARPPITDPKGKGKEKAIDTPRVDLMKTLDLMLLEPALPGSGKEHGLRNKIKSALNAAARILVVPSGSSEDDGDAFDDTNIDDVLAALADRILERTSDIMFDMSGLVSTAQQTAEDMFQQAHSLALELMACASDHIEYRHNRAVKNARRIADGVRESVFNHFSRARVNARNGAVKEKLREAAARAKHAVQVEYPPREALLRVLKPALEMACERLVEMEQSATAEDSPQRLKSQDLRRKIGCKAA